MDTPYIAILYTDPDVLPDARTYVVVLFVHDEPYNESQWLVPVVEEVASYPMQTRYDEEPHVLFEEAVSELAAHGWRICADEGWTWGESGAYVGVEREGSR